MKRSLHRKNDVVLIINQDNPHYGMLGIVINSNRLFSSIEVPQVMEDLDDDLSAFSDEKLKEIEELGGPLQIPDDATEVIEVFKGDTEFLGRCRYNCKHR